MARQWQTIDVIAKDRRLENRMSRAAARKTSRRSASRHTTNASANQAVEGPQNADSANGDGLGIRHGDEGGSASPVERAFRLLRFIAEGGATANLSEVARQIQVNRITVMRLLESLESAGLITATANSHQLGMGFLTLAASALGNVDLTARARLVLPGLALATGMSAYLVVRDQRDVVYMLRETAETPLISRVRVGSRLAAHTATPGLVLLAHLSNDALKTLYPTREVDTTADPLPITLHDPQRDTTAVPSAHTLIDTLRAVRTAGCAWSFSGLEAGIDSCAAPVLDRDGRAVAALSVAGPSLGPDTRPGARAPIEAAVKAAADTLSRSL